MVSSSLSDSGLSQGGTDSCVHPNSGLHPEVVSSSLSDSGLSKGD